MWYVFNIVNLRFWSSNNAYTLSNFNWCDAGYTFLNVTAHVCLLWMRFFHLNAIQEGIMAGYLQVWKSLFEIIMLKLDVESSFSYHFVD